MNTEHKILEMPDEEFLSFLYAERERDYAKYSSLGVNLWIAGAAIVGLLGHEAIPEDVSKPRLVIIDAVPRPSASKA